MLIVRYLSLCCQCVTASPNLRMSSESRWRRDVPCSTHRIIIAAESVVDGGRAGEGECSRRETWPGSLMYRKPDRTCLPAYGNERSPLFGCSFAVQRWLHFAGRNSSRGSNVLLFPFCFLLAELFLLLMKILEKCPVSFDFRLSAPSILLRLPISAAGPAFSSCRSDCSYESGL